MAEYRMEMNWWPTASLQAQIANAMRDRKKQGRPYEPREFNPFSKKPVRGFDADSFAKEVLAMDKRHRKQKA